jgi:gamma-glutamyltranspeptidase/glutathione hydrolase
MAKTVARNNDKASGAHGVASSAHPLATRAGIEILKKGGNAFDAAVAVAAALNVTEPMMSGVGGYGTILVYAAKTKTVRFLNSSGRIPAGLDPDVFRAPHPNYKENRNGPAAVSTPANVSAWDEMSRNYGALKWAELLGPAIGLAEQGFVIDEGAARMIGTAFADFPASAKSFYGRDGRPLRAGERLVQKDLGRTLRLIAENGAAVFHGGSLGRAVADEVRRAGGFLSLDDLTESRADWWEPIHIDYRGHDVYTASPPATAFPSLIRLGLMSRFDAAALGQTSAEFLHRFIEVTKLAFADRLRYAGDPAVNPPPLGKLLAAPYWESQVATIDLKRARPFVYPGSEGAAARHTTHFVVADAAGNIVSATQTLGNLFGSRIMPAGTGIWLNDSLAYCTFEPKGNPMDAHPGRRKLSGDCPTIIFKDGRPWAALGTPGGHTIGQTVPQIVMGLVDFGLDIDAALGAPRVSFVEPDSIAVEEAVGADIIKELEARGHKVRVVRRPGGIGNAHGLTIEYGPDGKPARFRGASDPRGGGLALAR